MNSIRLSLLVMVAMLAAAHGQTTRPGINPAPLYYQAFLATPDLAPDDRAYLFFNNWRGEALPERFGELVARFDDQFKLVRRARQATGPFDWGIDMSEGPATLLPHLARAKAVAVTARLRVLWDLQQARESDARDDLLAVFTLARHVARDGTLISALVQMARPPIMRLLGFGRESTE